ncbi:SUMF1/EgtB/PvdO family nonheme iron enzyme [uncultured Thiodictyon sp.]|uniref:formylglycine-generating enzyme family protein n=1 Tax=uncultured Thiodictyon sp. TaxID=1846217 RepID=UPI0025D14967|nr:SUMF1/EgtB/PvdO family nonheme iron enzyme [uncultured Thiodictyon sp.]
MEGLLLDLWWGDAETAAAVRELYRLYQQEALKPLIRERLRDLSAHGFPDDGGICLPWSWQDLPEATDAGGTPEPHDTARRRLQLMGFARHEPGRRRALRGETLIALGAAAGLALAGLLGVAQRLGAGADGGRTHDAAVYEGALFRGLVMEGQQGARHYAASRKLTATTAATGTAPPLHWCWSGLAADQAAPACRTLSGNPADPHRVNPQPLGQGALLRAGTLAEPIRACAPGWPALSVAVIAGERWDWPTDEKNNEAARRLAIRLLDRGTADLVFIGPDWAEQARRLAADWAFAADSQWLFFSPWSAGVPPAKDSKPQVPTLGTHRALLTGDLEAMARALDFPGARPATAALGRAARVSTLAGNPRLWGGPEVETGPQGIPFVHICPGTFTMGSPAAGPDTPDHLKPYDDEQPAHPVILDGFWIARTETTQAQYAALAGCRT